MILKIIKVVRNHPKKSIFFAGVIGFAANYAKGKYDEECLMRGYCKEAMAFGEVSHKLSDAERHVTVILNPSACEGKGKTKYEKYCAPLLHLAGMKVALVRTEHEGQAKEIMDVMDNTSAVIIAGGDGTVSEILTGLLRREDAQTASKRFPLGLLPLGTTNSVASCLWNFRNKPEAKHLAESTMAIVRNITRPLDVMEITPIKEEDEYPSNPKPIYAASELEWGAFRDARERKSVYWYWAFLKKYMVYVFSSYKDLSWNFAAEIDYFLPCSGCSYCKAKEEEKKAEAIQNQKPGRWWQAFVPRPKPAPVQENQIDYSKIRNEDCGKVHTLELSQISDFKISTNNSLATREVPGYSLSLKYGKENIGMFDFIKEGWKREYESQASHSQEILVGEMVLKPKEEAFKDKAGSDRKLSIDNEVFEVRPMKIRPVPNAVTVFALPTTPL